MWMREKDLCRRKLQDLEDVLVERFVIVETPSHDENSLTLGHSIICLRVRVSTRATMAPCV
jgi:hypothetical protein